MNPIFSLEHEIAWVSGLIRDCVATLTMPQTFFNRKWAFVRWWLLGMFGVIGIGVANAQTLSFQGVAGNKALISVNEGQPRFLVEGQVLEGVTLMRVADDIITVKVGNEWLNLKLGETKEVTVRKADKPQVESAKLSSQSTKTLLNAALPLRAVINADYKGQMMIEGAIDKKPVRFLLDTGASMLTMGITDAHRLGLNYQDGQPIQAKTAAGPVRAYLLKLSEVSIGNLLLNNVEAVVTETDFLDHGTMLLGMSFLSRVKMTWDKKQVLLEKY